MKDYARRHQRRRRPSAAERWFWIATGFGIAVWAGLWIAFGIVLITPWGT